MKRIAYAGDDRREAATEDEEENQGNGRLDDCGGIKRRRRTSPITPTKTLKPQNKPSPSPKKVGPDVPPPLQLTLLNC